MAPILLTWAGLAVALIYLPMSTSPPNWPRSLVKTLPLLAFATAAWLAQAPSLLVAALAFSALGDFALSRPGETSFLAGLTGFALAHALYVLVFTGLSGGAPFAAFTTQPLLAMSLIALALSSELWLIAHVGRLRWPVRAYVWLITLMGLAAIATGPGPLFGGALLFILSDLLLAIALFRLRDDEPLAPALAWLVWSFYITGQSLILAGAA